jgi:hypothetical protein
MYSKLDVVRLLVERGADVTAKNEVRRYRVTRACLLALRTVDGL